MEDFQSIQEGISDSLPGSSSCSWGRLVKLPDLVYHHQRQEHGSYHSSCGLIHLQLYQTPVETQYGSLACIRAPKGTC